MYSSPALSSIEYRLKGVERREQNHPHPGEVGQKCSNAARFLLEQYRQHFNEEARRFRSKIERLSDLSIIKSFPHFVDIFVSKPENGSIRFGIEYPGGAVFPFENLNKALEEAQRISDTFAENESKAA